MQLIDGILFHIWTGNIWYPTSPAHICRYILETWWYQINKTQKKVQHCDQCVSLEVTGIYIYVAFYMFKKTALVEIVVTKNSLEPECWNFEFCYSRYFLCQLYPHWIPFSKFIFDTSDMQVSDSTEHGRYGTNDFEVRSEGRCGGGRGRGNELKT